jgi:hypothetical protein
MREFLSIRDTRAALEQSLVAAWNSRAACSLSHRISMISHRMSMMLRSYPASQSCTIQPFLSIEYSGDLLSHAANLS